MERVAEAERSLDEARRDLMAITRREWRRARAGEHLRLVYSRSEVSPLISDLPSTFSNVSRCR